MKQSIKDALVVAGYLALICGPWIVLVVAILMGEDAGAY